MAAKIIDLDEFKPELSHIEAARMADKEFELVLRSGEHKKVIFMAGGSASGKTEFVHSHLFVEDAVIYDSTFSSIHGAEVKIRKCMKYAVDVEIYLVIPDDLNRAWLAFKNRKRLIPDRVFARTHSDSRSTVRAICLNYPWVKISIVRSLYIGSSNKIDFADPENLSSKSVIRYLNKIQITQKYINDKIINNEG